MLTKLNPIKLRMDDTRYQQVVAQIKTLLRELDPELSDEDIELALMRTLMYAEREKAITKAEHERQTRDSRKH